MTYPMIGYRTTIKRSHVFFLVFTFLVTNQFFNIYIIPIHVLRITNWAYSLGLALYVCMAFLSHRYYFSWLKKWKYLSFFLLIVTISFFYLKIIQGQDFNETFRASIKWYQYLILFILLGKHFSKSELFIALSVFSCIWFLAWIVGFISPFPLYDASGEFDEQRLMYTGRGIVRLKVAGESLMHLWGLWCLSLYTHSNKKKFLLFFLICWIFVILCVSRQHIVFYSLIGFLFLFQKSSLIKKIILCFSVYALVGIFLPKTEVFQKLTSLTETQMEENDGGKEDVRVLAMKYYVFDYPHNIYTMLLGNGEYHSHSEYGKHIYRIMDRYGYILADIGFVGIYFCFGILGLICFLWMYKYIYKVKITHSFYGIKLFFYYIFSTNIFSHSFDVSQISIAISLYLLYIDRQPKRIVREQKIELKQHSRKQFSV